MRHRFRHHKNTHNINIVISHISFENKIYSLCFKKENDFAIMNDILLVENILNSSILKLKFFQDIPYLLVECHTHILGGHNNL